MAATIAKDALIPKVLHYVWAGKAIQRFDYQTTKQSRLNNLGCKANLWLDAFSLAPDHYLDAAVKSDVERSVLQEYRTLLSEVMRQDDAKIRGQALNLPPNGVDLTLGQNWDRIVGNIVIVRRAFVNEWLKDKSKIKQFRKDSKELDYFYQFAERENFEVRFLDNQYMEWCKPGANPDATFLCRWLFTELWRLDPNYGAFGDLARILIMNEFGGIYCDHDDLILRELHDMKTWTDIPIGATQTPEGRECPGTTQYQGYKCGRGESSSGPVPSFQAAAAGHEFLRSLQTVMRINYQQLIANNYRWVHDIENTSYWQWRRPGGGKAEREASSYFAFTMNTTGPPIMVQPIADYSAPDHYYCEWWDRRVKIGASHAWLNKSQPVGAQNT